MSRPTKIKVQPMDWERYAAGLGARSPDAFARWGWLLLDVTAWCTRHRYDVPTPAEVRRWADARYPHLGARGYWMEPQSGGRGS